MQDFAIMSWSGRQRIVPADTLAALRQGFLGQSLLRNDQGYDQARRIWNGMVDRFPGLILRCGGPEDVERAVDFARRHELVLAVRGGGHNIAGNAVCEGGLMIDLSTMNAVRVDPDAATAHVGPGATLHDVDSATQVHGLAVPTGINSTTGIAGLTLGGGFGWITRKYGLTIDSLLSADLVTADARRVRVSADENEDLFWAIRGGGGNFGIVTNFEFRLHPVGPEVRAGLVVHPFDDAPALLRRYRDVVEQASDDFTCWVVLRRAPPLPFLPADWHGREVLVFAMCHVGDPEAGEGTMADIRALGDPIVDVVSPQRFVDWQSAFDPLLTTGARNYWKSHDFETLADGAIDVLCDAIRRLPGDECEVFIAHVGGAMSRVAPDATAYPQRKSHFVMNVHTRWRENTDDNRCIEWARTLFRKTEPYATGSAYVNFMPDDETDRVERVYGANYRRLARIKARHDPHNLFRMNQNIPPMA